MIVTRPLDSPIEFPSALNFVMPSQFQDDEQVHKGNSAMDSRRNVRAALQTRVSLQGKDISGKPFQIQGESVDFSRGGIGVVLKQDLISPGSMVSISVPKRFEGKASVQWSSTDANGMTRVGLRLLKFRASIGMRLVASLLLCLAAIGQAGYSRSRFPRRAQQADLSCTVSLDRMKSVLEKALNGYVIINKGDKAFLHIQHQHLGCLEYTRLAEDPNFYTDPKTRAALVHWHWTVYHSKDAGVREAAIHEIEAELHMPN
jgi:hypothetical protein